MLPSFRPLAVCHRSGASAFSICRLLRLQFSVPFFFGLPSLPALVLCSPEVTLLPLFQDWTFGTLASLPSVSQVGEPQPPLTPLSGPSAPPPLCQGTPHVPPPPVQGCQELILLVRRLTLQLEAFQTEAHRMARAAASPPPSRPAQPSPSHRASTPMGAQSAVLVIFLPPWHSASTPLSHPALVLVVAALLLHTRSAPQDTVNLTFTVTGVLSATLLFLAHVALLVALLLLIPSVLWASAHSLHQSEVSATLSPSGAAPLSDVLIVWNQLHLTVLWVSATCTARAPVAWCMILSPCRETARGRLADERRRHDPHSSRSISWLGSAQLSSVES